MFRIPQPLDGWTLGSDWIDEGTLARTRMPSPGLHYLPATIAAVSLLRPVETRLLLELDFQIYTFALAATAQLNERAMFLAQMSVESGGFTKLRENMHYSPERLRAIFPKYVKSLDQARKLVAAGPDAIADFVYGSDHPGLDNTEAEDGHKYVGRGYTHLTGRGNYRRAGLALGLDLEGHPELAEIEANAVRIAAWYWMTRVNRHAAELGDVTAVTRNVNGGENGLAERRHQYLNYRRLLHPG